MSQSHTDTYPGKLKVDFRDGNFASQLLSLKVLFSCKNWIDGQGFEEGELIASIEGATSSPKAYTSVQTSKDEHIEVSLAIYGKF
jgi:hypothetical protein